MNSMNSICVFCGSSEGNDPKITEIAQATGQFLAQNKVTLVYGAAKIGIMGIVAKAALAENGKVIGIIPEFLKTKEVYHKSLTELITTSNMHERKMKMQQMSDGFIALPGGFGTLEELFEIITWLQLGLHQKPIGILNVNGFYDPLIALITKMVDSKFVSVENSELVLIDTTIEKLYKKMQNFSPLPRPKYLNADKT